MSKRLLGLFVNLEEPKTPETSAEKLEDPAPSIAPITPTVSTTAVATPSAPAVVHTPPGAIDPQMLEMLEGAIEKNNLEGYDYFEFAQACAELTSLPEPQRFKTVYTVAKSTGVTPDSLVKSIEHYKSVITQQKEAFGSHVETKIAQEITHREQQKTSNDEKIANAQAQITDLTQAIGDHNRYTN